MLYKFFFNIMSSTNETNKQFRIIILFVFAYSILRLFFYDYFSRGIVNMLTKYPFNPLLLIDHYSL